MTKRRNGAKSGETSPAPTAAETTQSSPATQETTALTQDAVESKDDETANPSETPAPTDATLTEPVTDPAEEETVIDADALAEQAQAAEALLDTAVQGIAESAPVVPHADKTPVVQTVLTVIDDYMVHMDTNVYPSDENGKALQRRIYRTLRTIVEFPEAEDFIVAMQYLVNVVRGAREPQRAFNENRVFRFYENGIFNQTEARDAELLISFIIQMADGFRGQALNSALKMLVTSNVLTDTVVQRLGSFAQRYIVK